MYNLVNHYDPSKSVAFELLLAKTKRTCELFGFIPHNMSIFEDVGKMKQETGIDAVYSVNDPTGAMNGVGLRADHTVSLAYFVAQHQNKISFPFKRYASNPVYRPLGKDGYVEFHACDVDVVGRQKLSYTFDAEIVAFIKEVLIVSGLSDIDKKPSFSIYINNRKIINGLLKKIGVHEEQWLVIRKAIGQNDIDKIQSLLSADQLSVIKKFLDIKGDDVKKIFKELNDLLGDDYSEGVHELITVYEQALELGVEKRYIIVSPQLTRNMDYYTGFTCCAFLRKAKQPGICYGGRYSMPVSARNKESFPGVGATINQTLLFDYLVDQGIISADITTIAPVMVSSVGSVKHATYIAKRLREKDIQVELFLENAMPIEEQIKYAKARGFKIFVWTKDNGNKQLKSDDIVCMQDIVLCGMVARSYFLI